jgi:hypothetical protein
MSVKQGQLSIIKNSVDNLIAIKNLSTDLARAPQARAFALENHE